MLPQGGVGWPNWIALRFCALFMFEQARPLPSATLAVSGPKNCQAATDEAPVCRSIGSARRITTVYSRRAKMFVIGIACLGLGVLAAMWICCPEDAYFCFGSRYRSQWDTTSVNDGLLSGLIIDHTSYSASFARDFPETWHYVRILRGPMPLVPTGKDADFLGPDNETDSEFYGFARTSSQYAIHHKGSRIVLMTQSSLLIPYLWPCISLALFLIFSLNRYDKSFIALVRWRSLLARRR
jgi:hypothetical protein